MKRSRRTDATPRPATTLGDVQLGQIRGGAGMTEYILLSHPPPLVANPLRE